MPYTPEQWQRITDIFCAAIQKPSAERSAVIVGACAGDVILQRAVERLIDSDSRSTAFLEFETEFNLGNFIDEPGTRSELGVPELPGYEIHDRIGRGGQGVVYRATQIATKREVAIKVLLNGGGTADEARRRFRREFELVAKLRHPNIVVVFDVGETADGRPYAVMDYVNGLPLTTYLKRTSPPRMEVLRLFETICSAVAYAHEHQVIHRDLKPSNILVDQDGNPRILDFGLAKYLDDTGDSIVSVGILGTPRYMSPEQTKFRNGVIDKRTDVYALGVILFESLTGGFPYPVDGELLEVLHNVAATDPSPLARAWVSESPERAVDVASPTESFDRELETIACKALVKEQDRRYRNAGELHDDIRRYLNREPIKAIPPTLAYRFRKFMKRRWAPISITTLVVVLGFAALFYFQSWRRSARVAESETFRRMMSEAKNESFFAPRSAIERYKEICRLAPDVPEPLVRLAYLCNRENQPSEARAVATTGLKRFPDCAPLHLLMWRLLESTDPQEANAHKEIAMQLLPNNDYYRAVCMPASENDKAIELLTRILRHNGVDFDARWERAWRYFKSKDFEKMLKDAEHLTVNDPESATAWNLRALALSRIDGRYDEALHAYDESIRLAPNYAGTYINRADLRLSNWDFDGAIADCNKAIDLGSRADDALAMKARILRDEWRFGDAWKVCDIAFRSRVASGLTYVVRGELRMLHELGYAPTVMVKHDGNWPNLVVADIRKGLNMGPMTEEGYSPLFDVCPPTDQTTISAAAFLDDLQHGRYGIVHVMMGDAFFENGRYDAARKAYSNAADFGRTKFIAYRRCALVNERLEKLPLAIEDLDRAIDITPDDGIALFDRARLHRKAGAYHKSSNDFEEARKVLTDSARLSALRECGVSRMLIGDRKGAIGEFETWVDSPKDPNQDPDPAPYLWLWELYSERGNPGDDRLATKRLDTAASAASVAKDEGAALVAKLLKNKITQQAALDATTTPGDRCALWYYIGAAAAIKGDLAAASHAFSECVEINAPDVVEFYLARARLKPADD